MRLPNLPTRLAPDDLAVSCLIRVNGLIEQRLLVPATKPAAVKSGRCCAVFHYMPKHSESLERRILMSVTLGQFDILLIEGTPQADVCNVKVLDANSNQIEVNLNGEKSTWSLKQQFGGIDFAGGGGDDFFKIDDSIGPFVRPASGTDHLIAVTIFLHGGAGNDTLYGNTGWDSIDGAEGDDVLDGGDGNDNIGGGEGNDFLTGADGADRMNGDAGNDVLRGGGSQDNLHGGDGNDRLYGMKSNDKLFGDAGTDRLYGDVGADALDGGANRDLCFGEDGDDSVNGGSGNDLVSGASGDDSLIGGLGNDEVNGGPGNDVFTVGGFVAGLDHGRDTIICGTGNDIVDATDCAAATIKGDDGNDSILGSTGDDILLGGVGRDTLTGNGGTDVIDYGLGSI